MCGLSAIVEFEPGDRLLPSLLAMHDRIPHRGPDGEGFTVIDADWRATSARSKEALRQSASSKLRVGLAFRWLQIQDPGENSAQPMASADGSVWLTFNGEIYNFRELARELEGLGHSFASVGDTEVILAAYLQWGSECFSRLNGMWAIILADLRKRKLVFSRDRFGIKPLFYHRTPKRLLVASEIKQLLAAGVPAAADCAALSRFVRGARPETPERTFFENIFAQPAASYAEISLEAPVGDTEFRPYWTLGPRADARPQLDEACATLEGLLQQSVNEHMVAQVPIGHLVSGGLDSSLLAALAAPNYRRRGERGMAASMVMPTAPSRYDESVYIDQVTTALQFQSYKAELSAEWLKINIPRITWAQEEPVAGMAVAGQFLAYETAARHGARVVLDGQGADEIFAGYPRHQYSVLRDYAARRALPDLLRELTALARNDPRFFPDIWRLRIRPRLTRALGLGPYKPRYDFLRTAAPQQSAPQATPNPVLATSALTRDLVTDVLTGNLRPTLIMTDRNSMAHSIEARVPYVDRRIVEYGFTLPDNYKIGGGMRKRILRRIAARHLPQAIVTRVDRIGFGVPVTQWLTTDFSAELAELSEGPTFRNATFVDRPGLKRFADDFLAARHQDAGAIWRLYAIDHWARAYAVQGL